MTTLAMFSAKPYDRRSFDGANNGGSEEPAVHITYHEARLDLATAGYAADAEVVCAFVNDDLSAGVLEVLAASGTTCVALRCAGFNNVDLGAAERLGLTVVRVPSYSPNAVAEHTLALMLTLNRKIHRAHNRVRDRNFSLDGLVGFDMAGKTAAVIGTGQIGAIVARLLWHLRCDVVAVDPVMNRGLVDLGVRYVSLDEALAVGDIVTLNCPLNERTHHLVDAAAIAKMKRGVLLVNTGRGALVDTAAVLDALKSEQIGSVALDVYEEEGDLFFEDRARWRTVPERCDAVGVTNDVSATSCSGLPARTTSRSVSRTHPSVGSTPQRRSLERRCRAAGVTRLRVGRLLRLVRRRARTAVVSDGTGHG
jgi:D-lactate dehydrogenase